MRRIRFQGSKFAILALLAIMSASANESVGVVPGTSLSVLLVKYLRSKGMRASLFGPHGLIAQTAAINPEIKNIDRIYPGMIIRIPAVGDAPATTLDITAANSPEPAAPIPSPVVAVAEATAPPPENPAKYLWSVGTGYRYSETGENSGGIRTDASGVGTIVAFGRFERVDPSAFPIYAEAGWVAPTSNQSVRLGSGFWATAEARPGNFGTATYGGLVKIESTVATSSTGSGATAAYEGRRFVALRFGPVVRWTGSPLAYTAWGTYAPFGSAETESGTSNWSGPRAVTLGISAGWQAAFQSVPRLRNFYPELSAEYLRNSGRSPDGDSSLSEFRAELRIIFRPETPEN